MLLNCYKYNIIMLNTQKHVNLASYAISHGLQTLNVPSKAFNEVLKSGYKELGAEEIRKNLTSLSAEIGPLNLLQLVGLAIIYDPSGIWPSATFGQEFKNFKARMLRAETKHAFARSLVAKSQFNALFTLSISCPEIVTSQILAILKDKEADFRTIYELPGQTVCGDMLSNVRLISSYLTVSAPVQLDHEDNSTIVNLLQTFLKFYHFRDKENFERLQRICKKLFGDSFNEPWTSMPSKAIRLNFEFSLDSLVPMLKLAAEVFANLLNHGYGVSFKFTGPDLKFIRNSGLRLISYVPSVALPFYLESLKAVGLADLDLRDNYKNNIQPTTGIMLPAYVNLRSSGEDETSLSQGNEIISLGSKYFGSKCIVLAHNDFYDSESRYVYLLDGEKLNLQSI